MAFGRGEIWGQGLGNSVQKLEYLPEAHTDFIFAIIGEELGYIGVVLALLMVFFVAFRAMSIGRKALEIDHRFSGFLACSIGIWFSFQALVNVGAAAGMLPTKGLTLPLISYGGSSLLIMSTAIMFYYVLIMKRVWKKRRRLHEVLDEWSTEAVNGDGGRYRRARVPRTGRCASFNGPGWQVRWLGTSDRMEADLVPKHGIDIDFIRISGLRGKGVKALLAAPLRILTGGRRGRS